MKKRFLSFILVLFLVVPCIFLLTACGKVDAQVAVDKVLTDVINKYDNKIVTTRHLDFKKVVEYKGNTVYVYYNSEDEKDVSDDGIVYPERFEKEVGVAVVVKSGECEIPPCKTCYLPCSEKEKGGVEWWQGIMI